MGDAVNRRSFAGFGLAAVGGIFVPQFGRWFQRVNEQPRRPCSEILLSDSTWYGESSAVWMTSHGILCRIMAVAPATMHVESSMDGRVWIKHSEIRGAALLRGSVLS